MRTTPHFEERILERYYGNDHDLLEWVPEVAEELIAAAKNAKTLVSFINRKGKKEQYITVLFEGEFWGIGVDKDFRQAKTLLNPHMVELNREKKGFIESYIA